MVRQSKFIACISLLCLVSMAGCSAMLSATTKNLANNISNAVMNNDDPATVEAGMPAHMLMIDGFIEGNPNNASLLSAAASLYTAYTFGFVKDEERIKRLTDKALDYGLRGLCARDPETCGFRIIKFQDFKKILNRTKDTDVPELYALGTAWAGWIQTHQDEWDAVAEIPRVEEIMLRIIELDESYQGGGAHVYLGVFSTLLSPTLGGKPEKARNHFERALELSKGKNLMIKVSYAQYYTRMIFDRELHDRLLKEVLQADPHAPGYTLLNVLAKQQAQELLDGADDYF